MSNDCEVLPTLDMWIADMADISKRAALQAVRDKVAEMETLAALPALIARLAKTEALTLTAEQRTALCCDIRRAALKIIDLTPAERAKLGLGAKP